MNKKKNNMTVNIGELTKQRPVLNEEEMNKFYTYEEAVDEAMRLFVETVAEIENRERNGKN